MISPRSLGAATLAVLALAAVPASGATHNCPLTKSEWTSFGVTYVPKLWVAGTSCANGKAVVRAFHKCRKAHGGITGRCPVKVLGYRCKETRTTGPQQISSKVVCSNGSRRVGHYYNQNT